jgi:membrane-bound lytic murein transglycosylase B
MILAGGMMAAALPKAGRADDFASFLAGLQARAVAAGIPETVVQEATGALTPNADVLRLDHHQAEFTETWATYASHVLSAARIADGQQRYGADENLVAAVTSRFGVAASVLLGIWGIETNYGKTQGNFGVIDALTTLAWDRGGGYFADQVIAALQIVAGGYQPAGKLIGSYAGAMGQPQFMPSVYLTTAVAFDGSGRPDIWGSDADTLASMANYLRKAGWRPGEPSAAAVFAPAGLAAMAGRTNVRTVGYWLRAGAEFLAGAPETVQAGTKAALLMPDGAGGAGFLVFHNFGVIRRYNASDFYALAVGELGRLVTA